MNTYIEQEITKDIAESKRVIQTEAAHIIEVSRHVQNGEITITEYMAQLDNAKYLIQSWLNRLADCAIWRNIK